MPHRSKGTGGRHAIDVVRPSERVEHTDLHNHTDQTNRPGRAERAKMISVRLTMDEFEALSVAAGTLGIGPSTLARTLIRRGLSEQAPAPSAVESHLEAHLQANLQSDLVARVEALERWVAEH